MLAEQYLQGDQGFPYRYEPVEILDVPYEAPVIDELERRGTIVIGPAKAGNRFTVVWQDTDGYHGRVAEYLQS
jgi:hypothetical protein